MNCSVAGLTVAPESTAVWTMEKLQVSYAVFGKHPDMWRCFSYIVHEIDSFLLKFQAYISYVKRFQPVMLPESEAVLSRYYQVDFGSCIGFASTQCDPRAVTSAVE